MFQPKNNKFGLKDKIAKELKMLHIKFVVAPIDKTSNNVTFVCQRQYVQVLINELGLHDAITITPTYMKATRPVEKVASGNI